MLTREDWLSILGIALLCTCGACTWITWVLRDVMNLTGSEIVRDIKEWLEKYYVKKTELDELRVSK